MGIGDMINKAKDAVANITGDEKKSDDLLDKGASFANSKFAGHEDKVQKVRDAIDDKVGDNNAGPAATDKP